jgi:type VI secretion system protein ImpH
LGVLPRHYTQMAIDRVRARDFALRDFLDLFHHRIVSYFHRAWVKHHVPVLYESARRSTRPDESDLFTRSLLCFVGLGTSGLRDRLRVPDESLLYYSGQFAHFPRNAISLERMIEEYFGVSARVLQFWGQWLQLEEPEQTRLMTPRLGQGWNNRLGVTTVAGRRVWGIESKFRIQLGPLSFPQFLEFSPLGDRLMRLVHFVRTYAGPDLDCEIQPVLRRPDVPGCRLGDAQVARLGWTTWILSQSALDDADDAVFSPEADRVS